MFRKKAQKRKSKNDKVNGGAAAAGAKTPPSQVSPPASSSATDKFALLALCPTRKTFEIKELAWKQANQPAEHFLQRLASTLKPTLAEESYTSLVDGKGNIWKANDDLRASEKARTLLVAIPETKTAKTCHKLAPSRKEK